MVSHIVQYDSAINTLALIQKPSEVPAFFKVVYNSWRQLQNLFRAIHKEHIFAFKNVKHKQWTQDAFFF